MNIDTTGHATSIKLKNVRTAKSLIIFDLDGTLIDSAADLATAVNRMYAKLSLPAMPIDTIKSWVGNGSVKLVQRALAAHGIEDEAKVMATHEIFLVEYASCSTDATSAYDGVITGIKKLKSAGFRLAICTNKPTRYLPGILAHFGWQDSFDAVLGGDALPTKKPNPAPLIHISNKLGVSPDDAIMVGDSKNDVLAGQAAGMMTLALSYGYNYGEPIAAMHPDAVFDDFGALVQHLLAYAPIHTASG